MPELPEVETIRKQLSTVLPLKVSKVTFSKFYKSIVKTQLFSAKGKQLLKIERKGKVLDFVFSEDQHLISRLGMSGSWQMSDIKIKAKHTHLQFECLTDKGQILYLAYIDPRRFGSINFFNGPEAKSNLDQLGIDVSSRSFTANHIKEILEQHPNRPIKPLLLEQKYFAGIGNYIASEMCALAGILPTRLAKDISLDECKKLAEGCKNIIRKNIKSKGLTFHGGYVDALGNKGDAVKNLVVFNQKICGLCQKNEVSKIVIAGRGTYYCSKCQK